MRTEAAKSTHGTDEATIATLTADLKTKRQAHAEQEKRHNALRAQAGQEGDAVARYEALIDLDGIEAHVLRSAADAQRAERLLAAAVQRQRDAILKVRAEEYRQKIRALDEALAEAQKAATEAAEYNDETERLTMRRFTEIGFAAGLLPHPDSAFSTWRRIMSVEGFLQR